MHKISSGTATMWSAYAFLSSDSDLNPQVTPIESTQARRAVSMSTPESPTKIVSALGVGHSVRTSNIMDGSGLVGTPSI